MFNHTSREEARNSAVVVFGLGRFGTSLARELEACGAEVLGVDRSQDVVDRASSQLTHVVRADSTSEETLRQLGVPDFGRAVVAIGEDLAQSILTASVLKKIGGIDIWAQATSPEQGRILEQMGIEHVFYPSADMGRRAAHVVLQSVHDYLELGYGFALIAAPAPKRAVGRTLGETNLRRREGITIVAVRSEDDEWDPAHAETYIHEGDTVLIIGPTEIISRLRS